MTLPRDRRRAENNVLYLKRMACRQPGQTEGIHLHLKKLTDTADWFCDLALLLISEFSGFTARDLVQSFWGLQQPVVSWSRRPCRWLQWLDLADVWTAFSCLWRACWWGHGAGNHDKQQNYSLVKKENIHMHICMFPYPRGWGFFWHKFTYILAQICILSS